MSDFQKFITDVRLVTIIETLKRSNNTFKIVKKFSENQHSDILQWLFDPREGHGQGDAIFKDFLTAAFESASEHAGSNKQFFKIWTPSRIARTGFHSILIEREFTVNGKRLDLLMVDATNKIIVAVENKHGAKLGKAQLSNYTKELEEIKNIPAFKSFTTAKIVLDKNYNDNSSDEMWAFLGYSWLERSAQRAEFQLKRGNQSARLVIDYCQEQFDYVPPEEKQIEDFLANLAKEFRPVIKELYEMSQIRVIDLESRHLKSDQSDLWHFAKHYPDIVQRLLDQSTFSYIQAELNKKYSFSRSNIHRTRLTFFAKSWEQIELDGSQWWPITLTIREDHSKESEDNRIDEQKYYVSIYYGAQSVAEHYREKLTDAMKNEFPVLKKGKQNVNFRCIEEKSGLSAEDAEKAAIEIYEKVDRAIKAMFKILN